MNDAKGSYVRKNIVGAKHVIPPGGVISVWGHTGELAITSSPSRSVLADVCDAVGV